MEIESDPPDVEGATAMFAAIDTMGEGEISRTKILTFLEKNTEETSLQVWANFQIADHAQSDKLKRLESDNPIMRLSGQSNIDGDLTYDMPFTFDISEFVMFYIKAIQPLTNAATKRANKRAVAAALLSVSKGSRTAADKANSSVNVPMVGIAEEKAQPVWPLIRNTEEETFGQVFMAYRLIIIQMVIGTDALIMMAATCRWDA